MSSSQLSTGRKILFSGILLLFLLAFLEITLQLFYFVTAGDWLFNRTGVPIFEEDPNRCFRLKSGLEYAHHTNEFDVMIYTNGQGIRTDSRRLDFPYQKEAGVYRILFLGPSFAFGWGNDYEETYAALIGEMLKNEGLAVEVINVGTPAQGPAAQLCWLAKEGYRFQPDMIVQTTYGKSITTVVGECPEELACPIIENSVLYKSKPTLRKQVIARVKNLGTVFYGYYAYNALRGGGSSQGGEGKELYSKRGKKSLEVGEAAFVEDFRRYRAFVRETVGDDTEVVFVFLPLSYLVHPEDIGRWSHLDAPEPDRARHEVRTAATALTAAGLDLVDITDALVERGSEERLYYWLDIHLTPAGNHVVAETVAPRLATMIGGAR